MTLQVKLVVLVVTLLLGFGTGFGVRTYMAGKHNLQVENTALSRALTASIDYQAKVEARDTKNQVLQSQLATLDKELTNARTTALSDNAALRSDLAVAQRMQLKGTTCPSRSASDQASPAAGVDHGAQVELSPETRLAVFDLRESIIGDQAALEGCQSYVRRLGLYP